MAERFGRLRLTPAARVALPAALTAACLGAAAAQSLNGLDGESRPSADYRVECSDAATGEAACAADLVTYIGWRVFDRYCASCHGDDAEGSTFAPSLVHRLQRFDRRAFDRALDEGYAGPFAGLRPWGEHPQVARYYDELWAYLSGRASGDVPPVPLRPLREHSAEAPAD